MAELTSETCPVGVSQELRAPWPPGWQWVGAASGPTAARLWLPLGLTPRACRRPLPQAWDLLSAHQGLPAEQVCPSFCCALLSWVIPMDWPHSRGEPVWG